MTLPRPLAAFFSLALLYIAVPAPIVAQSVVDIEVPAPALVGNLLETATTQRAAVYLPPGYDDEPDRRYPVLYLLHGIFDSYETWTEYFKVPAMLDRLISTGELPKLLVVMPNAGNKYGGGFYRNSSVSGNWADFIAQDLVDFVDTRFRTVANGDGRAIVGHSMGGYGALHLAMNRPGLFSVVWAMSPCCLTARDDLGFGNDAWKRAAQITTSEDLQNLVASGDFFAIAALGVITAFSPSTDRPPIHGDFPFAIVRGEVVLDNENYDRYLDEFPVRQIHGARAALRSLHGLALDVGLGDQFLHIPTGTLEFSQLLGVERIPHILDVYDGDHRELVGERLENIVLPWVGERLDKHSSSKGLQ